jgi:hypothetical protein
MKNWIRFVAGIVVPAIMLGGFTASSAAAADKAAPAAPTIKVLLENDKVKVLEITWQPGAENTAVPTTSARVIRVMKGGTLQRIHPDGTKESSVRKAGEVYMLEAGPAYTVKNAGKTVVQLYEVVLK